MPVVSTVCLRRPKLFVFADVPRSWLLVVVEEFVVEQLQELSTALSLTENAALKKISAAASDLQSKLKAIEETRDEHVGLLEEELMDIQRNRQKK